MPDAGISTAAEQAPSTTLGDAAAAVGNASNSVDEWHQYIASQDEDVHAEMVEAREVLHMGTPTDAIELANRDVPREASDAAARWQASTHV